MDRSEYTIRKSGDNFMLCFRRSAVESGLFATRKTAEKHKRIAEADRRLEGEYAVQTDSGIDAWGVSLEHARRIANRVRYGSAKILTTSGRLVEVVRL